MHLRPGSSLLLAKNYQKLNKNLQFGPISIVGRKADIVRHYFITSYVAMEIVTGAVDNIDKFT